jgi:hypothetical protein
MTYMVTTFDRQACAIEVLRGEYPTLAAAKASAPAGRWEVVRDSSDTTLETTLEMWHAATQTMWTIYEY